MSDKHCMKKILEKAFEAGKKNALKPFSTDYIDEECPDFERWYEQELEDKEENRVIKCPNCDDEVVVFPDKGLYERFKNSSIFKRK